jgi:hypothetical protein
MRYIDWILPLNVKNTLKKYFQKEVPIISEIEEEKRANPLLEKNKVLNNSVGENKTCYILACGPSINEMDLSKLKGEDCISVSNFFVHPLYNEIQPKYHIFAPTHPPIIDEQYNSWIEDFHQKTKFETKIFLNSLDKSITDNVDVSKNISRYYYELTDIMPDLFDDIVLEKPLPKIQTVVHIAIYTAISLGYKEICLLGIDHNWILNYGHSQHFYEEKDNLLVKNGYQEFNDTYDLEGEFKSYLNLWQLYKSIRSKFVVNGLVKIYNLTPNSMLDVFERKNI